MRRKHARNTDTSQKDGRHVQTGEFGSGLDIDHSLVVLLGTVLIDKFVVLFCLLGFLGNIGHLVLMMVNDRIDLQGRIYGESSSGHSSGNTKADKDLRRVLIELQQRFVAETYQCFFHAHGISFF